MSTLYPLYYNGGTMYSTGWPTSSKSAIFTVYANWAMMPIFENPNNFDIKITNVRIYFGVNGNTSAEFALYYSTNISENSQFYKCSANKSVPSKTDLTSPTVVEDVNLVIPARSQFALGFKANRTSGSGRLSIARSNTKDKIKYRPFYNGQSMSGGLPNTLSINRLPTSDYWSFQVPRIELEYVQNKITPIVSNTNVVLNQGESTSINISGYSGWSHSVLNNPLGVSFVKNDNNLEIISGEADFVDETSGLIRIYGVNSYVDVNITIIAPQKPELYMSNSGYLRPGESVEISSSYGSGVITTVPIYVDTIFSSSREISREIFSLKYLDKNLYNKIKNSTYEDLKNWANGYTIANIISFTAYNSLNKSIKSDTKFISIGHYSADYINVSLSAIKSWGKVDDNTPTVKYFDNSNLYGGSILEPSTNANGNVVIDLNNKQIEVISNKNIEILFNARLLNDWPVLKYKVASLTINETIPFSYNGLDDINKLDWVGIGVPQYENDLISSIKINPICYPIKITFPSNLDGSISIKELKYTYTFIINDEEYKYTNEEPFCINYNDIIDLSTLVNEDQTVNGKTYLICNSFGERTINLPNNISASIDDKIVINGTVSFNSIYFTSDNITSTKIENTKAFSKSFKILVSDISAFFKQNSDIQGSKLELNSIPVSSINNLQPIVNSLSSIYLLGYKVPKNIISLNENSYVSNSNDKSTIENIISMINNLVENINYNSSLRYIKLARNKIANNEYIMWDDSVDTLADGRINKFKNSASYTNYTASPWKELYNLICRIHFSEKYNIVFNNNGMTDYVVFNNESDISQLYIVL